MKELNLIAAYIDSAIRILYNSKKETFKEIWGDDGPYLWSKFVDAYKANEGSFICYLDHNNQAALAKYVKEYALKNDFRAKDADLEIVQLRKDFHFLKNQDGSPYPGEQ
jgi:hypothetical protein